MLIDKIPNSKQHTTTQLPLKKVPKKFSNKIPAGVTYLGSGILSGIISTLLLNPLNFIYVSQMKQGYNVQTVIKSVTNPMDLFKGVRPNMMSIAGQNMCRLPGIYLFEQSAAYFGMDCRNYHNHLLRIGIGFGTGFIFDTAGQHIPFVRKNMQMLGLQQGKSGFCQNLIHNPLLHTFNLYKNGLVANSLRNGVGFTMAYWLSPLINQLILPEESRNNPLYKLGITIGSAYIGLLGTVPGERLAILKIDNPPRSYRQHFSSMINSVGSRNPGKGLGASLFALSNSLYRGYAAKGIFIGGNNTVTLIFKDWTDRMV